MCAVDRCNTEHNSPRPPQFLMASFYQGNNRFASIRHEYRGCQVRGAGSLLSVTEAIDCCDQHAVLMASHDVLITGFALAGQDELGHSILDNGRAYGFHFFTATVVPWPGCEVISNSSINLRTPGNPIPRLPEVEKPSRNA